MLVHVEIPDMSLNLQDPLLRLTGIHPRQTGGPLFCQILTDFARGGRRANSTPGPARGANQSGAFLGRGTKVCSRHLGHMAKMAAMLIYGKNLSKIFFVKPVDRFQRNVVCSIGDSCIIVCSNDDIRLTLTYFTPMSNFVT